MEFKNLSGEEFIKVLATKEPVPGGGGASAFVGAIGTALGNMVGSLTVGKKKYKDVEEEVYALKEKADELQNEFLALMDKDAEAFYPLSQAYALPKNTEEEIRIKEEIMEKALVTACLVPMEIMKCCCKAIDIIKEFAKKGSVIAISDAGVAATFCRSALEGASLNVFINTKSMKNKEYADELNEKAKKMLACYVKEAESIFQQVSNRLQEK